MLRKYEHFIPWRNITRNIPRATNPKSDRITAMEAVEAVESPPLLD
jgi:hypothetical protein